MKRLAIIASALLLAGCSQMTNEQIIAATKTCQSAGMRTNTMMNGWTGMVVAVQCIPPRELER